MILVSHRGNTVGKNLELENTPKYIEKAIKLGYEVEVDLWVEENLFYLGHDYPQHLIQLNWLEFLESKLWIHCKNIEAFLTLSNSKFHYFWHEDDTITITSKGYPIAHYTKNIPNTISVMPEISNFPIENKLGVVSDYIKNYSI